MSNLPPKNSQVVVEEAAAPAVSRKSQRIRRAIFVSIVVHLVGAIALLCWYVPAAKSKLAGESTSANSSPRDTARRDTQPVISADPPGDDVSGDEIQKSLESQIEAAKQIPDERKLDQLEKNLKRLESVASPESVDEVATKIASSLGIEADQYAAKKPEDVQAGEIDLSKAQVANVSRTRNPEGGWDYVTTLVDDSGREMEIPVTAAEGETMYRAFEQMKKFPVAAGIYRKVVMPMMQKVIEAQAGKSPQSRLSLPRK